MQASGRVFSNSHLTFLLCGCYLNARSCAALLCTNKELAALISEHAYYQPTQTEKGMIERTLKHAFGTFIERNEKELYVAIPHASFYPVALCVIAGILANHSQSSVSQPPHILEKLQSTLFLPVIALKHNGPIEYMYSVAVKLHRYLHKQYRDLVHGFAKDLRNKSSFSKTLAVYRRGKASRVIILSLKCFTLNLVDSHSMGDGGFGIVRTLNEFFNPTIIKDPQAEPIIFNMTVTRSSDAEIEDVEAVVKNYSTTTQIGIIIVRDGLDIVMSNYNDRFKKNTNVTIFPQWKFSEWTSQPVPSLTVWIVVDSARPGEPGNRAPIDDSWVTLSNLRRTQFPTFGKPIDVHVIGHCAAGLANLHPASGVRFWAQSSIRLGHGHPEYLRRLFEKHHGKLLARKLEEPEFSYKFTTREYQAEARCLKRTLTLKGRTDSYRDYRVLLKSKTTKSLMLMDLHHHKNRFNLMQNYNSGELVNFTKYCAEHENPDEAPAKIAQCFRLIFAAMTGVMWYDYANNIAGDRDYWDWIPLSFEESKVKLHDFKWEGTRDSSPKRSTKP